MTLVFAGTPEFAALALRALIAAGHDIPLVLTQPDRPAGRGLKTVSSPVKQLALANGLRVEQPESLKSAAAQATLREAMARSGAELMVVAAYGLILPQAVLDMPRRGCLNIHASLLPRWRGAAPIQRAIQAGDDESGVCIMQMDAGLDTGPVLLRAAVPITDVDTAGTLHDKLAALGARLVVEAIDRIETLRPQPQPTAGITYAHKLAKAESGLDFQQGALALCRQVRALAPAPGATALVGAEVCKIWSAQVAPGGRSQGIPGEIIAADKGGIVVACGEGALCITELQRPGGKRLKAQDFLLGTPLVAGASLALITTKESR